MRAEWRWCGPRSSGSSVEQLALGPRWRFWRRRRLCVAALALLGFVHLYTARVNLSVAIVHMTTPLRSRHVASAAGGGHGGGAFNVSSPAGHALAAMPALLRAPLRHCHHHQHHPRTPRGRRRHPRHHHCSHHNHHHHRRRRRCHPHLRHARHGAPADAVPDVGVGVSVGGSISPEAAAVEEEVVVVDARPEFDWDSRTQGWLLAAFFYGYAASQVPAGLAAGRLGAARLFGVSVGASSVLALLSPAAVRTGGFAALLVLRVVLGLFGGLSLPAMSALWARWAPPTERARLASLAASGTNVGTVLVFFLSGALALHFGWASIFYVFGVLGLMWLAAWVALVFEGPEEDPSTPPEELLYLRTALAGAGSPPPASSKASLDAADGGGGDDDTGEEASCTPWRAMACSPPLLALTAAHVAHNWGAVTFLMQLPRYLHEVHLLEVGHMGIMAAVPYVLLAASLPGAGHLSDMLVRKKLMSVTQARKAMLGGTLALQALLMLTVAHAASRGVVLGCVLAVVATGAFPRATLLVNHLDLSPRHAGLLMGVTNSLATLPGIISPVVTGFLVTGEDPQQWHAVFYIMAVLYAVGAAAFIAFGSAELQPWAMEPAR